MNLTIEQEKAIKYDILVAHLKAYHRDGGFIIPKSNAKVFRDALGIVDEGPYGVQENILNKLVISNGERIYGKSNTDL